MACYRIEWKRSATRDLRKLDRKVLPKIVHAVEALADNPRPIGCRKLQGSDLSYRIRIGDYRVVYSVFDKVLVIQVVKVGHRCDIYRNP